MNTIKVTLKGLITDMAYPHIIGEYETLSAIKGGMSIARYGDGEFNLAGFRKCVSQEADRKLQAELQQILQKGSNGKLAVAVPPLDNTGRLPEGKKRDFWTRQAKSVSKHLNPKAKYYSSFITRSDNAPWIDTPEFWNGLVDLWRDKDITLVIGSERSLCERNISEAKSVKYVRGLYRDSYREIDRVEKEIRDAGNKTVILCLGATATVLAYRLCNDFHALDLGHIGMKRMFMKGRGLV